MSRTLETIIKKALSGYAEIVNFDKPDKTLGTGDARYTEWYIALADNQAITMRLTTKGEIYQVLVNGKLMPIRSQDEPEKAIQEVINRLTKERSAIIKKNSVTKVIDPPTKKERKSTLQTLTEKRDDLKVKIADAKAFLGVDGIQPEPATETATEPEPVIQSKLGKVSKVKTAKGTEIETRFKLVDAADLMASHDQNGNENPLYPQELQPRDRSKLTSQAWVAKTSKNLDIDSLGKTRRADSGAPIVGNDNVVESGNGRTMAIIAAYNNGNADEYRAWLESEAEDFGLDPQEVKAMDKPILVRERITDIDRRTFAKEANEDDKLAMTATEQARSDADKLDESLIQKMTNDGDLTSRSNRDFVVGFLRTLGDAEAAKYYTTDGAITKQAYDRLQSAIFAKAYNNDKLLELMADDAKPEIKNIIGALNAAAGQFIQAKAISESKHKKMSGTIADGVELSLDQQAIDTIINATQSILNAKNKGLAIEEYLGQDDLFGDGVDAETAAMALFIKENNKSSARMAVAFKEMASFVNKELVKDENQSLFDDDGANLLDVLKAANAAVEKQYGKSSQVMLDLFDMDFNENHTNKKDQGKIDSYVLLAADSITSLRKQDVFRVLDRAFEDGMANDVAEHIKSNRPELADDVDLAMKEIL